MKRTACLAVMFTLGTVCHPFHGRSAHACGATPLEVNPLLPLDATIGAGLDIVLISSSNLTEATFALLEVGPAVQGAEPNAGMPWPPPNGDAGVVSIDGDAGSVNASDPPSPPRDAGSPLTATDTRVVDAGASEPIVNTDEAPQPVDFKKECFAATRGGGAVCIARPLALLKPNTRYEWAVVAPWAEEEPSFVDASWRSFTTGTQVVGPVQLSSTEVTVEGRVLYADQPCGIESMLTVKVAVSELAVPLVVNVAEVSPGYVTHAQALTAAAPAVEMRLYNAPDCIKPEIYDQTGQVHALGEVCSPVVPATDGNGDTVEEPHDGEHSEPSTSSDDDVNEDTPSANAVESGDDANSTETTAGDIGLAPVTDESTNDAHRQRGVDSPGRTGCTISSASTPTPAPLLPWSAAAIALVALRRFRGRR